MKVAGAGLFTSFVVVPSPRRMVVVSMVLRNPGKLEDTPFLSLAHGDMPGGGT